MIGHRSPFIIVSGNIATGKSTLVRKLGAALGVPAFPERVGENPFFGPPDQAALQSELWFLNSSIAACVQASGHEGGVIERAPEEHLEIFGQYRLRRGWLTLSELGLLEATFAAGSGISRQPDLLIHLDLGADSAIRRVRQRDRRGEQDLDYEYLADLQPLYDSFLRRWTSSPVLRVYADELDFHNDDDFGMILTDVQTHLSRQLGVALRPGSRLPTRAYPGDAGLDLASAVDATIPPLERLKVPTGVSMHIPEGHVGFIVPRSGYASKHGITHLDGPGVIDAGYREQVHFLLYNTDKDNAFTLKVGDRLGQIVIVPFLELMPDHLDGLTPTVRGNRGFGSST